MTEPGGSPVTDNFIPIMQTVYVSFPTVTRDGETVSFMIDDKVIAEVRKENNRYLGSFKTYGVCDSVDSSIAFDFVCNSIYYHFRGLGLDVEFIERN